MQVGIYKLMERVHILNEFHQIINQKKMGTFYHSGPSAGRDSFI